MTVLNRVRYWTGARLLHFAYWVYPTWKNEGSERVWKITAVTDGISDDDATSELIEAFRTGCGISHDNVHTTYVSTFGLKELTITEDLDED